MAAPLRNNILAFEPSQSKDHYNIEHFHTPSEHVIYFLMYRESKAGTKKTRFSTDKLTEASMYRDRRTIMRAIRGLLQKEHIVLVSRLNHTHLGSLYAVVPPKDVFALHRNPEYEARQAKRIQEKKERPTKPRKPKRDFDFDPSLAEIPSVIESDLAASENVQRAGVMDDPMHQPNDPPAENLPVENSIIFNALNLSDAPMLGASMHQPNDFILIHEFNPITNHSGVGKVAPHARMREGEHLPGDAPTGGVPPEQNQVFCQASSDQNLAEVTFPDSPPVTVPPPTISGQRSAEVGKPGGNSRTTVPPEKTPLGRAILVALQWQDTILDHELRGQLRQAIAWFALNSATPEEILRYHAWRMLHKTTSVPPIHWLKEDFPAFRFDEKYDDGETQQELPGPPLRGKYLACAKQMFQTYIGHEWESFSEKIDTFKRFVAHAGIAWNDDLANEIFQ